MVENNNSYKKNNSKKIIVMVFLILFLMISVTGATYAYFALSATSTNTISGTTANVSLNLTVTPVDLATPNTGVMVPQLPAGIATAVGRQCVDDNGNVVCKVYSISITNTSSAAVVLNGRIKFFDDASNGNTMYEHILWRKIKTATTVDTVTTGSSAVSGVAATTTWKDLLSGSTCRPNDVAGALDSCTDIALDALNGNAIYYIVVWLNEVGASNSSDVNKSFYASINFEAKDGTGVTSTIVS